MFDTHVTVVGNVVAEPRSAQTRDGHPVASFRLASTPRRFDRATGEWRDAETMFISVTCWRALAENVLLSLKKGSAVIVMGKMSIRPYETKDGDRRQSIDIDAMAVGPDLGRAVAVIKRTERGVPVNAVDGPAGDRHPAGLDDPGDADANSGTPYADGATSAAAMSEHEWLGAIADDQVDDEVSPGPDTDSDSDALAGEAPAPELAAAGSSGGRWRRGGS